MITEYHFPTPIYIKNIPNAVQLNQYLEQQIVKWSQTDPKGHKRTNVNGWHSTTDMNQKEEYNVIVTSLHSDLLNDKVDGYFFDVITNGKIICRAMLIK